MMMVVMVLSVSYDLRSVKLYAIVKYSKMNQVRKKEL